VSRRTVALAGAGVVVLAASVGGVVVAGADHPTAAAQVAQPSTATVQRGDLSAAISQDGTLTYRARSDGSPYAVINRAPGTYTGLPEPGDRVDCGGVLYRVDGRPVVLLCGTVPVFRTLRTGVAGQDVRQLNRNLRTLGYAAGAHVAIRPGESRFTARTGKALRVLQHRKGVPVTGRLARGDAVFLPGPARIAKVAGELGGSARPGGPVLTATSDTLHVQLNLDPSQQGEVSEGDSAQITLPGNRRVTGTVSGFGRIAQAPSGPDQDAANATVPTYIRLGDPRKARGLDRAPVGVEIRTEGVKDALSVPVTALVGRSGGGFAVEVIRAGERRDLVAVRVGLFDTAEGRVEVEGDLRAGDRVAVPSP
jgi:hypothetical protein